MQPQPGRLFSKKKTSLREHLLPFQNKAQPFFLLSLSQHHNFCQSFFYSRDVYFLLQRVSSPSDKWLTLPGLVHTIYFPPRFPSWWIACASVVVETTWIRFHPTRESSPSHQLHVSVFTNFVFCSSNCLHSRAALFISQWIEFAFSHRYIVIFGFNQYDATDYFYIYDSGDYSIDELSMKRDFPKPKLTCSYCLFCRNFKSRP